MSVNASVIGCLFLCINPETDWQPVQGAPYFSVFDSRYSSPSDLELDNQKRMDGWCVQEDQKQKLQTITFPAPSFNFLSRASCCKRPDFCPYIHWTSNWGLLASMPFVHEFPYSHSTYFKESFILLYSCSLSRTKRKPEPTCQRFTKQRFHL